LALLRNRWGSQIPQQRSRDKANWHNWQLNEREGNDISFGDRQSDQILKVHSSSLVLCLQVTC
jgi:hypothetical protein